jgi:hypothetical protein
VSIACRYLGVLDERGLPTGRGKLFSQDNQEGISIYYFGEFKSGKFHGRGRSVNIEHIGLTKEQKATLPKNVYQWTGTAHPPVFLASSFMAERGCVFVHVGGGLGKEKLLQLGTVYEGNWEEGKMHGKGRLSDPNDESVYEGDFNMVWSFDFPLHDSA